MASFKGFTEDDFGHLRGSSWRGRDAIGGVLASTLHHQTGRSYRSWGVTRRLELHIAAEDAYRFDEAQHYAKLFVYTHTDLVIGFYIEPCTQHENDKPLHQHWYNFQQRIQRNYAMRCALLCPMANHGLKLTNYYEKDAEEGALQGAYAYNAGRLQYWHPEIKMWTDTHVNYLVHQIAGIHPENPTHLHLFTHIDKKTAIEMGSLIVDPILKVLRALLPLYEMTIE